jgi:antirestriction protein ArdC
MAQDIYQRVTDTILAKLDEGVVPWRKPFAGYGERFMPRNYNSNRPYRGINVFLLAFTGYSSPYWLTFDGAKLAAYEQAERAEGRVPERLTAKQLKEKMRSGEVKVSGGVRKGEKSTLVIFWKKLRVDDRDAPANPDGTRPKKNVMLLRYFNVFSVEQCDGVDPTRGAGEQASADERDFDPVAECEAIKAGYFEREDAPAFSHGGNVAFYDILGDAVKAPHPELFDVAEEYYSAVFHEAVHSTGAKSRLARKGIVGRHSTEAYADEELTAEMGAAMLCATAGIAPATLENSAAYIDHWRRKISEDPKLVVMAGARAQKAADFVLGATFDAEENADSGETNDRAAVMAA